MRTATSPPDASVTAPITAIDHCIPNASASTPASSAPTA
jgi:hypothetical protein